MATNKSDQVFDVAKPGKQLPDATARPIIVGHGNMARDPMVSKTADIGSSSGETKDELKPTGRNKVIVPLTADTPANADAQPVSLEAATAETAPAAEVEVKPDATALLAATPVIDSLPDDDETKPATDTTDMTASEEEKPAAAADEAETTDKTAKEDKSPAATSSESAVVDAVVDQAASKKKDAVDPAVQEAEKVKQEHLDKLVADKRYFLPIGRATRHRNTRNGLIVLAIIVVLAAGGGYAAYTMGLLKSLKLGS